MQEGTVQKSVDTSIKSGAEISDDELGYSSSEETPVRVKDNQIGGARK